MKYKIGDKVQVCLMDDNYSIIYSVKLSEYQIKNNKKLTVEIIAIENTSYFVLITEPNINGWKTGAASHRMDETSKQEMNKKYPNGRFWEITCEDAILFKVKEICNICKRK